MTVDGTAFTARREAGDHLIACLRDARARVPAGECHTTAVGTIGGFQLTADLAHDGREHTIVVQLADLPGGVVRLDHRKLPGGIGLVTRLENRLTGLDKLRLEQQAVLDRQRQEITRAQAAIGVPFPQQDALLAAKKALDDLVTELRGDKNNKDGAKADPAAAAAGSAGLRHDVNRDIRPAAGTRPARTGGLAATNTTQALGRVGVADSLASAKPAAAGAGTSHGTGTDWTSGHPFSAAWTPCGRQRWPTARPQPPLNRAWKAARGRDPPGQGRIPAPAGMPAPAPARTLDPPRRLRRAWTAPRMPPLRLPRLHQQPRMPPGLPWPQPQPVPLRPARYASPSLGIAQARCGQQRPSRVREEPVGVLIEHHRQGSLVHGTSKDNLELRGCSTSAASAGPAT